MVTFKQLLEALRNPPQIGDFKRKVAHMKDVDARDTSWQGTLPALFELFGFKQVGSGKYGTVFVNPKYPYVVKVFMRDTAYLKWLQFCMQNQNNKYVPKIKGKVIKVGNIFMAVRLEKLNDGGNPSQLYFADDKGDKDATAVVDFLEKNNNLIDLHPGNVMMRGDQLVIIDPFYNWYKGGRFQIDPDDLSTFRDIL